MHDVNLLQEIFGDAICDERSITITSVIGDNITVVRSTNPADAQAYGMLESEYSDVYFSMALVPLATPKRGKASDAKAIGALWTDIDCRSPGHPSYPTKEECIEHILDKMPFPPTTIVDSGYGYHAYWLFKEPWVFSCEADRLSAGALSRGWHILLAAKAKDIGHHIDPVWDLARILRLPGTTNHKYEDAKMPVRIISRIISHNTRRYEPSEFEEFVELSPPKESRKVTIHREHIAPDPKRFKALYDSCQKFRGAWDGARLYDSGKRSASEDDMSIATIAAIAGWAAQEIADLLVDRRLKIGHDKKANRTEYIRSTVAKAMVAAEQYKVEGESENSEPLFEIPEKPEDEQVIVVNHHEDDDPTDRDNPGDISSELMDVPGFVTDYMSWVTSRAAQPCPVAAFGGALAMLSFLTGRKLATEGDCRSNFYFVVIGKSGVGKNAPRSANALLLTELGAINSYAEDIQTAEGLEDFLEKSPASLWQPDEFDVIMRNMGKEDMSGNGRWEALSKKMRTIYTSANTLIKGRVRARARKGDDDNTPVIHQPHLVMYASATPASFLQSISTAQVQDGLLSRCTIIPIPYILVEQEASPLYPIPANVLDHARAWAEYAPAGNLQQSYPRPHIVQASKAAKELFAAYRKECNERRQDYSTSEIELATLSRAAENAQKASLLYAASAGLPNGQGLHIDEPAAFWAISLTRQISASMLYHINLNLSDSPFGKAQLKVIRTMKESGGSITKRSLARLLRSEKDAKRIIEALKAQERIEECQIAGKRKTSAGYKLTTRETA